LFIHLPFTFYHRRQRFRTDFDLFSFHGPCMRAFQVVPIRMLLLLSSFFPPPPTPPYSPPPVVPPLSQCILPYQRPITAILVVLFSHKSTMFLSHSSAEGTNSPSSRGRYPPAPFCKIPKPTIILFCIFFLHRRETAHPCPPL